MSCLYLIVKSEKVSCVWLKIYIKIVSYLKFSIWFFKVRMNIYIYIREGEKSSSTNVFSLALLFSHVSFQSFDFLHHWLMLVASRNSVFSLSKLLYTIFLVLALRAA